MMLLLVFLALSVCDASAQKYREIAIPTRLTNPAKKYLLADAYMADSTVRKPVILIQTPYNKAYYRQSLGKTNETSGARVPYNELNYNYVIVDWRGFYSNKSADTALYNRGLDGYDIVEWIAAQPWCNGKVGSWGGSALGQIQFLTAAQQPPHLLCAAPFIKDFKTEYNEYYCGGDYRKEHVQSLVKLGFVNEQLILSHPARDNYWILAENLTDIASKIDIPLFMCGGWFDHFPNDVIRAFNDIRQNSAAQVRDKHKILFGPWTHSAVGVSAQGALEFPNAADIPVDDGMKFFDFYLRGENNNWEQTPAVRYYQMGENEWRSAENFKDAANGLKTLYFHENSLLSFEPPPVTFRAIDPDTLRADPKNPVPTIGGSRFNPFDENIALGPQDISILSSRSDALHYSTEPLDAPIRLNGQSQVKLHFICNRADADISVRLCDIYPDGRWIILTQGMQRLRFRNSLSKEELLVPGAPDSTAEQLSALAITFLPGHRIGLVISGSNYPMFDINPNSGKTLYAPSDTMIAETYISLDRTAPSFWSFESGDKTSGIAQDDEPADICSIYPNPANGEANVYIPEYYGASRVRVANMVGETLFATEPTKNHITLPTEDLPSGIYSAIVTSKSISTSLQLVIIR